MKIKYNPQLKQLSRNLRNKSTLSEVLLWKKLKSCKMKGYQFSRQKPIGEYIVDFYCSKLNLIIEIDGESHSFKYEHDVERQKYLESLGLHIKRFSDLSIKTNLEDILRLISLWIEKNESTDGNVLKEKQDSL